MHLLKHHLANLEKTKFKNSMDWTNVFSSYFFFNSYNLMELIDKNYQLPDRLLYWRYVIFNLIHFGIFTLQFSGMILNFSGQNIIVDPHGVIFDSIWFPSILAR